MAKQAPERIELNDISFTRRDPEKIGNSFHDYDIFVEDFYMGRIDFSSKTAGPMSSQIIVMFGDMNVGGIKYNLPISIEKLSTFPNNEKIFDIIRPMILQAWRIHQES